MAYVSFVRLLLWCDAFRDVTGIAGSACKALGGRGETDDLVGEAFVAHVHTSGILMSGVAVPAHFLHLGSGSVQHDVLSDPVVPICRGLWKCGRGYRDLVFVEFNSL